SVKTPVPVSACSFRTGFLSLSVIKTLMFCDVGNYGYNEQKAKFAMNTSYCTVKVSTNPMACCYNSA
ncbi:hypothetical protein, partial [Bacteroides acidifaciens]|uniref:hypothetical protein n=1 Tax=Bacteroides acidifaciens TaxID=85831 RepID=UPI00267735FA